MEQLAKLEAVLGEYGGQIASFEWVFSPRGSNGRPTPLFDRVTGEIDPSVAAYWGSHYDIAQRIDESWHALAPDLQGKIHLWVGTDDTFYLDGAARRLQTALESGSVPSSPGHCEGYRERPTSYSSFGQDRPWCLISDEVRRGEHSAQNPSR